MRGQMITADYQSPSNGTAEKKLTVQDKKKLK
jgi:hypothetical protein